MATTKQPKRTSTNILYLHVSRETKRWLKRMCNEQKDHVSQSQMAEMIFKKARKQGVRLAA